MEHRLSISFQLLVGEEHIEVEELLNDPESLLDYYLSEEDVTDSTFQGGYCITVDGKKWNGNPDFYFNMFTYSLNWLEGIEQLLVKEVTTAEVGFWKESVAKAVLIDEHTLEITDASVNGRTIAASTRVDFYVFCRELLKASRTYEELATFIHELILAKSSIIDADKAKQIVREMCGADFVRCNDAIETLLDRDQK